MGEEIRIIIDSREPSKAAEHLRKALNNSSFSKRYGFNKFSKLVKISTGQLPVSDYLVTLQNGTKSIYERKTVSDLIASIKKIKGAAQSRLTEQRNRMLEFDASGRYLIIEAGPTPVYNSQGIRMFLYGRFYRDGPKIDNMNQNCIIGSLNKWIALGMAYFYTKSLQNTMLEIIDISFKQFMEINRVKFMKSSNKPFIERSNKELLLIALGASDKFAKALENIPLESIFISNSLLDDYQIKYASGNYIGRNIVISNLERIRNKYVYDLLLALPGIGTVKAEELSFYARNIKLGDLVHRDLMRIVGVVRTKYVSTSAYLSKMLSSPIIERSDKEELLIALGTSPEVAKAIENIPLESIFISMTILDDYQFKYGNGNIIPRDIVISNLERIRSKSIYDLLLAMPGMTDADARDINSYVSNIKLNELAPEDLNKISRYLHEVNATTEGYLSNILVLDSSIQPIIERFNKEDLLIALGTSPEVAKAMKDIPLESIFTSMTILEDYQFKYDSGNDIGRNIVISNLERIRNKSIYDLVLSLPGIDTINVENIGPFPSSTQLNMLRRGDLNKVAKYLRKDGVDLFKILLSDTF